MLKAALDRLNCKREECLVLMDGLNTGFTFAKKNGLD